jgi:O-antigen/teichoic acid export membrane protein
MLKGLRHTLSQDGHLKELLTGSLITFGLKMSGMLLAYVAIYLISQKAGPEDVGIYSVMNQLLLVLATIGTWGTSTSVLRYIGQHHEKNPGFLHLLRKRLLTVVLPISCAIGLGLFLWSEPLSEYVFHHSFYDFILTLTAVLLPFFALNLVDMEFIRGLKILKVSEFLRSVLRPLILVIGLQFFWGEEIETREILYLLAFTIVLSTFVSSGVVYFKLWNLPRAYQGALSVRELVRTSSPMMVSGLAATLLTALPLFWIEYTCSLSDVGVYGIAVRLSALISLVLMVVNTMAAPKFSSMFWNKEHEALQRLLHQSAKLMFWAALILSGSLILLAAPLLDFFGEEYLEGEWALIVLIIGQFINTATGSVGLLLNMSGLQHIVRNSALFALSVQVLLLFALIPEYDVLGGALAFTISSAMWNFICILYAHRRLNLRTYYLPFMH